MTILMDGQPVLPNDPVYDVVYGPGIVNRINDAEGTFGVRFGPVGFVYNGRGVTRASLRRTLYWANPVVFLPPKESRAWTVLLNLVRGMWPALSAAPLAEFADVSSPASGGQAGG